MYTDDNTRDLLSAEAIAIRELGATVIDATDISTNAIEYALNGWAVFPLRGKIPAIRGGRGVLDATTDLNTVIGWWAGRYKGCNIGGRVPESMIVVDVDPRNGGFETLADLEKKHGRLPDTLTHISGRGDGGKHLFFRRPAGKLSATGLGAGLDLKTDRGYVVLPPSLHPDSGKPYTRIDAPVAAPPRWLINLLVPPLTLPYSSGRSVGNAGRYTLACLVNRINAAPEGRRNTAVFGALLDALRDGNLADFEDDLVAAAQARGLSHTEVASIVRSVRRNGVPS